MASARRRSLNSELPAYAPMLADYHRAFAPELQEIIGGLPIQQGDRVLDFASGDGSYAQWLAQRVGPEGVVLAVDRSAAFLRLARRTLRSGNGAVRQRIGLLRADIHRLPLADDTLDLVWCAQSLYSLPEPVDALRRMARIVRPGGARGRA